MKTLSRFIAEQIIDRGDYFGPTADVEWEEMVRFYAEDLNKAIEAYKKHLQEDSPKTVNWAMRERELIVALERMQSEKHLNEPQEKETKHKSGCASHNNPPRGFASSVTDCDCKDLPNKDGD
jgi:hypothetical protein